MSEAISICTTCATFLSSGGDFFWRTFSLRSFAPLLSQLLSVGDGEIYESPGTQRAPPAAQSSDRLGLPLMIATA